MGGKGWGRLGIWVLISTGAPVSMSARDGLRIPENSGKFRMVERLDRRETG